MAGTMRALIQTASGYAAKRSGADLPSLEPWLELANVEVPSPGPEEVLIKVRLAGVNPSDVMFIKGLYGQPRIKGKPAGFEGVGTVEAAGGPAGEALVGRRVAFTAAPSGSWAGYAVANAARCIPLIDGLRDEDGAGLIVNPLTALAMLDLIRKEGQPSFVLTAAASQLCKFLIQAAAGEGFRPIAVVRRAGQAGALTRLGAAHVLDQTAADFGPRIAELCRAEKPRILLDASTGPVPGAIFAAMGRGARWVIYGRLDDSPTIIPEPGQLIFQRKRIEGFWLSAWLREAPPAERSATVADAQRHFVEGRWRTDVTAIVPLEEAFARLPAALAKSDGKMFIRP